VTPSGNRSRRGGVPGAVAVRFEPTARPLPLRPAAVALLLCALVPAGCGSSGSSRPRAHRSPSPASSASTPAARTLSFVDPIDVAAADDGSLWVADYRDDSVSVLLRRGGRLALRRRVGVSGGPNRLAVDRRGRIWAAMWDAGRLVAWDPARGPGTPAVVIRAPGVRQPTGLGFDDRGWLWVTTQRGRALLGFAPSSLRRSARVRPDRRVPLPGGGSALAEDVAFDPTGRAYVVEYEAERLVVVRSLHAPAPRPTLVVHLAGDGPVGARRGPDGAVWLVNSTSADLTRVTDGGHRRRRVRLDGANMPHSITFVGRTAYVTDPTAWLLAYRVRDLTNGAARPTLAANP
jgi:sugar lactone lactonase YvrE